jgi:hypothetical protein
MRRALDYRGGGLFPHAVMAAALAIVTFYSAFLNRIHGIASPMVVLLLIIWAVGMWECEGRASRDLIAVWAAYLATALLVTRFLSHVYPLLGADAVQKLFALAPASFAVGWILVRTGRIIQYLSWYLAIGLLTVVPAVGSYALNRPLLGHRTFARNGHVRAVVGADHPLVLGTLLLACIPLAFYLLGRWRYLGVLMLYVGVFTTGSNGPEIVGGVLILFCALRPLARMAFTTVRPLTALLVALGVYLTLGGALWWGSEIRGFSTSAVSDGYRTALYHLMITLLIAHPFGYGFHGLPGNTWYFSTQKGIVDAAASIDSELVYGVTQFGYLWVAVFVAIAACAVAAIRRNQAIALSSLSVTLAGLFLAIHSWNSLGSFWAVGFGSCAALVFRYPNSCTWTSLGAPVRTRSMLLELA